MPLSPLPIDYDAIRVALVSAIAGALGLPEGQVVMLQPEEMDSPRPNAPYVGILVTTASVKKGQDWFVPLDDGLSEPSGKFIYAGDRTMSVGFDFFGVTHEQAYGLAATFQSALDQPPTLNALQAGGMSVREIGDVADISSLLNTEFEGRAHMDCSFGLLSAVTVDVGRMDSFNVSGTFSGTLTANNNIASTTTTVSRGD